MSTPLPASMPPVIRELIDTHSLKAQHSAYDAGVCVLAVSAARDVLADLPDTLTNEAYLEQAIERVASLANRYHDSDGQFTSGRSAIIGILDDLFLLKNPAPDT